MLVQRATQGFSLAEYHRARDMGWQAWLDWQLEPEAIADPAADDRLRPLRSLSMTPYQLAIEYQDAAAFQPVVELRSAFVFRSLLSQRQLHERMVEFWTDHFNTYHLDGFLYQLKTVEDREVIRGHALGNFGAMLRADAHGAAMLWYLDNYNNVVGAAQENYARELMELHTLGVRGPYTEQDVKEVARCFTGWTAVFQYAASYGNFVFAPGYHDDGGKLVLNNLVPPGGGVTDGEFVLDLLAGMRETAEFVGGKLCRWLVGYDPPPAVKTEVADAYMATGGDIKAMVRAAFRQRSAAELLRDFTPKLKRPSQFVFGLLRASSAKILLPNLPVYDLFVMGQLPYDWIAPNGYPDAIEAWGSSVLPRWDFASRLFGRQMYGVDVNLELLFAPVGGLQRPRLAEQIDEILTGGALSQAEFDEIDRYLASRPRLDESTIREGFALAASAPSYQMY
ncbi:MAG TPA: DUF1800 domain-containing protein [Planctomycetota bacterium]